MCGSSPAQLCARGRVRAAEMVRTEMPGYTLAPALFPLTAIPRRIHRISSDLRSQAAQGPVSTGVETAREDLRVLSAFIGAPYALCVCRVNIALQLDTDPVWSVYNRMPHAEMKLDAA